MCSCVMRRRLHHECGHAQANSNSYDNGEKGNPHLTASFHELGHLPYMWGRSVHWLSVSAEAFLVAGKGPGREVAVVLHRVPAGLDAAHVGLIFTDVMGNGHCGARTCMALAFLMRWICTASRAGAASGSRCSCTRSRTQLYLGWYCACRRHRAATNRKRGLRYVADFWAALGRASRLPVLSIWGVGPKAQ